MRPAGHGCGSLFLSAVFQLALSYQRHQNPCLGVQEEGKALEEAAPSAHARFSFCNGKRMSQGRMLPSGHPHPDVMKGEDFLVCNFISEKKHLQRNCCQWRQLLKETSSKQSTKVSEAPDWSSAPWLEMGHITASVSQEKASAYLLCCSRNPGPTSSPSPSSGVVQ